ncbi:MAG: ABC transporter permease [Planctomycetota bacterium]
MREQQILDVESAAGSSKPVPCPESHSRPLRLFSSPFFTLLEKETRRFLTVIVQTVVTPLVTAGLYLTIFVGGLGRELDGLQGVSYLDFLLPGLAMMGALNHSFNNAASSFMISKFQNNLVDVLVTPLTDLEITCAYAIASVLRGMLVGILTWIVTLPFGGRVPEHPMLALTILCFGSGVFAFLGVGAGVVATKFDDIARVSTFVILPFTYLGGVFIPVFKYPASVRPFAYLNPLLYSIDGLRIAYLGKSDVDLMTAAIVIALSLGCTVTFSLLALRFAKAIRN